MQLGVIAMLAASALYNAAPIFLRLAARSLPDRTGPALVRSVLAQRPGLIGLALILAGWGLEVLALTTIPLTLVRGLFGAGLILLLVLARRDLGEPLGWHEVAGAAAIVGGIVAVAAVPLQASPAMAAGWMWMIVLAALVASALVPYVARARRRPAGAALFAVSAGAGYGIAGILNKALADLALNGSAALALVAIAGAASAALLGFAGELAALERGRVSRWTPVYRVLQIGIPIASAPLLFGERWPDDPGARALLVGGIALILAGVVGITHRNTERHDRASATARGRYART